MERYAPALQGPGAARLRLALHGPGDQGRPRLRSEQGLHPPRHDPPGRRDDHEAPALGARDRPQLRQRRHHQGADPRRADDPLPDGRHPHQHPRPGRRAQGRRPERGDQRPVRGRRMLLRERARRQPPGHQLAARPAGVRPRGRQPHRRGRPEGARPTSRCRPTRPTARWRAWRASSQRRRRVRADVANDIRSSMQKHAGVFRTQALLDEGVDADRGAARARRATSRWATSPRCSTRRASRRWKWRT